jgi:hypothetical protein
MDMLDYFNKNIMQKNKKKNEKFDLKKYFPVSLIKKSNKKAISSAKFNKKLFNILKKMTMKEENIKLIIHEDDNENVNEINNEINNEK